MASMASLGAACLGILTHCLGFFLTIPEAVYANATVSVEGVTSPLDPGSTPNANENPALLSPSNLLAVLRTVWRLAAFSLSYLIHIPKVVYLPIKHVTIAFIYVIEALLRPLYPILAPFYLAFRIFMTPILVPVLLLYRMAVLVYPLYVFLGAAVVCGAMAGLLARRLDGIIVKDVFGFRSQRLVTPSKRKRTSSREKRVRIKTK
ncbi:hypothetical protein A7U60_g4901 [Sanghuangporus baumii]|uniref:Transmembrane protein n=1 Tax=Sanghuangporus baumii TaxID=108892 RepID=A0A9Q5HY07_SANBA|nr:hypothetical protein A7U60_g4901 [Sanghuangporus baumii]